MWEIFEELRLAKGVSAYQVAKACGIPSGAISNWKKGRYSPKIDKLQKIADYFGVSVDYLRFGKDVQTNVHGEDYYLDKQAAEKAQAIYEKYGALFDAAEGASADDIQFCIEFLKRVKGTNTNDG